MWISERVRRRRRRRRRRRNPCCRAPRLAKAERVKIWAKHSADQARFPDASLLAGAARPTLRLARADPLPHLGVCRRR